MTTTRLAKFSSKLSTDAAAELRAYARERDRPLAHVLDEAVRQYLARARLRPAFRSALTDTLSEHAEVLGRMGDEG